MLRLSLLWLRPASGIGPAALRPASGIGRSSAARRALLPLVSGGRNVAVFFGAWMSAATSFAVVAGGHGISLEVGGWYSFELRRWRMALAASWSCRRAAG